MKHMKEACLMVWFYATDRMRRRISSVQLIMKEENCVVIPEAVADEDAMGEALACLINVGAQMALAAPGDPFVVVGCGYMGLGTISLMRAMGAGTIIGVDIREEARENALKYGADVVYSPDTLPEEYFFSKHN